MSLSVRKEQLANTSFHEGLYGPRIPAPQLARAAPMMARPAQKPYAGGLYLQEDDDNIIDLDELLTFSSGVTANDLQSLKRAGVHSVNGIAMITRKDLAAIPGISEAKAQLLSALCHNLTAGGSFISGTEVLQTRGGFESRSVTELFGEFRTGKTQLVHTLCVTAQLPKSHGGGQGKVAYIDTEGTFRPEKIIPIAKRFGADPDKVLNNIVYARAYTHEQQETLLTAVSGKMIDERFALLVIDSLTNLFRTDFSGRQELMSRQQALLKMLTRLQKLATEYNIAIVVTNQVMSDTATASLLSSDSKKPVGGHVVAHALKTRLWLRKGQGDSRTCLVYDSPSLPEGEATFRISDDGIADE